MGGSTFGTILRLTVFGESRGNEIGAVLDGLESGFPIDSAAMNTMLRRRRPSQSSASTSRIESDEFEITSGVLDGKTTGAPICIVIPNRDCNSDNAADTLMRFARPGHADLPYHLRYCNCDHRGGGRASGRLTAAIVAAGSIAIQILSSKGIEINCQVTSVGGIRGNENNQDDRNAWESLVQMYRSKGETVGGTVSCRATGIPAGIGEPLFDKLDAVISHAVMSIPAIKGIEFGSGFGCEFNSGSTNDGPLMSGGVLGGLSDGTKLSFRAAVKPVPTTDVPVEATDLGNMMKRTMTFNERHDWCICFRICPVVEAMTALSILDLWYQQHGR